MTTAAVIALATVSSAPAGPPAAAGAPTATAARDGSRLDGATSAGGTSAMPGRHALGPIRCGQDETVIGYAGLVRPADAAAARADLGRALLAQVGDTATGQVLDLTRAKGGTRYFSGWLPVYPQAREPDLLSCYYLLTDKPADRPIVTAAIAATVRAGYFRSAGAERSRLQAVLVSDDPAAPGSLIVTLQFTGPVHPVTAPKGVTVGPHPPLHGTISCTVLEQRAGAKVTGVARGGF
jgi:hypothetical protein